MREIVTFGFKHGLPVIDYGDAIVDCRALVNPHRHRSLRALDGRDARVQAVVRCSPEFDNFWLYAVSTAAQAGGTLYVGCTGGRHRSVSIALMLAKIYKVPVRHRDLHRRAA